MIYLHPDEIASPLETGMRLDDREKVGRLHPMPPVLIRYVNGRPYVVDGMRRYTAARHMLGQTPDDAREFYRIPCGVTESAWSLRLDNFALKSLNVLLRSHWGQRKRVRDEIQTRWAIAHQNAPWTIPPATGRRRVTLRVNYSLPSRRPPDPDNIKKYTLDSLVQMRLLVDDTYEFCECRDGSPRKTNVPGVVLVVEDIASVEN